MNPVTAKKPDEITKRFQSIDILKEHGDDALAISNHLRSKFNHLAEYISDMLVDSRETSLCMTKLEEAMFYANASIARNGVRQSNK